MHHGTDHIKPIPRHTKGQGTYVAQESRQVTDNKLRNLAYSFLLAPRLRWEFLRSGWLVFTGESIFNHLVVLRGIWHRSTVSAVGSAGSCGSTCRPRRFARNLGRTPEASYPWAGDPVFLIPWMDGFRSHLFKTMGKHWHVQGNQMTDRQGFGTMRTDFVHPQRIPFGLRPSSLACFTFHPFAPEPQADRCRPGAALHPKPKRSFPHPVRL